MAALAPFLPPGHIADRSGITICLCGSCRPQPAPARGGRRECPLTEENLKARLEHQAKWTAESLQGGLAAAAAGEAGAALRSGGQITDHLGYAKHEAAGKSTGNSRNRTRAKTAAPENPWTGGVCFPRGARANTWTPFSSGHGQRSRTRRATANHAGVRWFKGRGTRRGRLHGREWPSHPTRSAGRCRCRIPRHPGSSSRCPVRVRR